MCSSDLHRIKDRTDILTWGKLDGFNRLDIKLQHLFGVLASSGGGKSLILQKQMLR